MNLSGGFTSADVLQLEQEAGLLLLDEKLRRMAAERRLHDALGRIQDLEAQVQELTGRPSEPPKVS